MTGCNGLISAASIRSDGIAAFVIDWDRFTP
jgi:hypothetical protein